MTNDAMSKAVIEFWHNIEVSSYQNDWASNDLVKPIHPFDLVWPKGLRVVKWRV